MQRIRLQIAAERGSVRNLAATFPPAGRGPPLKFETERIEAAAVTLCLTARAWASFEPLRPALEMEFRARWGEKTSPAPTKKRNKRRKASPATGSQISN